MHPCEIRHLVVPGTFDPITFGHLDVIGRACRLAPQVTVAVATSEGKNGSGPVFSLAERISMVIDALDEAHISGVEVKPLTGMLVDFCHENGASGVVKGLRQMTDFEYELQQADLNYRLAPDVESIFVMSNPKYGYVSSSIVRDLAAFGADVGLLVPPSVAARLSERFDTTSSL